MFSVSDPKRGGVMAYTNQQKAAVCAALLLGGGVRSVARNTGIPRSTVSRWRHEIVSPLLRETAQRHNLQPKRDIKKERTPM